MGAHYGTFQMFGPGARDGVNDKMKAHFLKLLEAGAAIQSHSRISSLEVKAHQKRGETHTHARGFLLFYF